MKVSKGGYCQSMKMHFETIVGRTSASIEKMNFSENISKYMTLFSRKSIYSSERSSGIFILSDVISGEPIKEPKFAVNILSKLL